MTGVQTCALPISDGDPERGFRPHPPKRLRHFREDTIGIKKGKPDEEDLVGEIVKEWLLCFVLLYRLVAGL